jgi:menaquinol-cytochrome c reductase iron-sulfur subunit
MTNESTAELAEPTRRRFYVTFVYGLWAVITGMLSIPALVYLFFPPKAKKSAEWVDVADLSTIRPDSPEEIIFRRSRVDGWKIMSEKATAWVVKTADNKVIAFAPQCTHLGCAYHWDAANKNFLCPCHTSTFAMDGHVLGGPAPRPLDRYAVKIDGNKLQIGPLQRSA